MSEVIIISLYFIIPLALIYLVKKVAILDKIGVVVLSYAVGIIMALSGLLPEDFAAIQNTLTTILIPISIPLLLFSADITAIKNLTDKYIKSLLIGVGAVLISVAAGFYMFMKNSPDGSKVAGLLTGVYTGGTPNLASIKAALNVDAETYLLVHSTDMLIGAFFLLFFISIAKSVLCKFLPESKAEAVLHKSEDIDIEKIDIIADFSYGKRKKSVLVLSLSVLVFAMGGGLSLLFPEEYSTTVAILSITTISILLSFYKPVNNIKQSFSIGMYFILVFSVVVASMLDLNLISFKALNLFYYVSWAMLATFVLQVILAKIFNVSADVTIVTATALIMSPPFVPVVAAALKNRSLITPGIIIGLIGYVIGNYLGVIVSFIL